MQEVKYREPNCTPQAPQKSSSLIPTLIGLLTDDENTRRAAALKLADFDEIPAIYTEPISRALINETIPEIQLPLITCLGRCQVEERKVLTVTASLLATDDKLVAERTARLAGQAGGNNTALLVPIVMGRFELWPSFTEPFIPNQNLTVHLHIWRDAMNIYKNNYDEKCLKYLEMTIHSKSREFSPFDFYYTLSALHKGSSDNIVSSALSAFSARSAVLSDEQDRAAYASIVYRYKKHPPDNFLCVRFMETLEKLRHRDAGSSEVF